MFPARDGVYTIEQVREKFLAVFSEEFTDYPYWDRSE